MRHMMDEKHNGIFLNMLDVLRVNHKISGLCYNFVISMCHSVFAQMIVYVHFGFVLSEYRF